MLALHPKPDSLPKSEPPDRPTDRLLRCFRALVPPATDALVGGREWGGPGPPMPLSAAPLPHTPPPPLPPTRSPPPTHPPTHPTPPHRTPLPQGHPGRGAVHQEPAQPLRPGHLAAGGRPPVVPDGHPPPERPGGPAVVLSLPGAPQHPHPTPPPTHPQPTPHPLRLPSTPPFVSFPPARAPLRTFTRPTHPPTLPPTHPPTHSHPPTHPPTHPLPPTHPPTHSHPPTHPPTPWACRRSSTPTIRTTSSSTLSQAPQTRRVACSVCAPSCRCEGVQ